MARYPRLLEPPRGSFFLLGPRGTGKTTWTRARLPHATRFDLLDEALHHRYLTDPGAFGRELAALPNGSWVVVDEVQRLPSLLNEVHRAIESKRLRFALTGSSARKLRRAGVNLLAGRAVHRTMHSLAPAELGRDFDLGAALRWGTLPIVWTADDRDDTLAAYARTYLREEIQAEAVARNLPGFARFLAIAGLFHGQVLNVSGLARDAGVSRPTVADYLTILEDTLVAIRLPAFEGKLRARERRHPKLFFVDPGIARSARGARHAPSAEERGALLEGFVLGLIRLYRDLGRLPCDELGYWAPGQATETEVDFVIADGKERLAIEVKSRTEVRDEHMRGLRAIASLPGLRRRALVHAGSGRARTADGIDVLGVREFAEELHEGRL